MSDFAVSVDNVCDADVKAAELGAVWVGEQMYPHPRSGSRFNRTYFDENEQEIGHLMFLPDGPIFGDRLFLFNTPRVWHRSLMPDLTPIECCGEMGDDGTCSCYDQQD